MRWIVVLLMGVAFVRQAAAQTGGGDQPAGDEAEELQKLMQILDEETTIATKTRLNSDYVPGMVTVLQGEDLRALGISTVWEALSLVPGIQISRNGAGDPFATVRGLPFPFNSGNIKILINSVTMSRETSSLNTSVLLLPVEQVERIEVIRGPGSSVYGNFAFMGLVNIITEKADNRVFAGVAAGDRYAGGAKFSAGRDSIRATVNVTSWTSDDGEGPVADHPNEDRLAAVNSLQYRNTVVSWQLFYRRYAAASSEEERSHVLDVRHHADLSKGWYADVDASYMGNRGDTAQRTFRGGLAQGEADLGRAGERVSWLFALSGMIDDIDIASLTLPNRPQAPIEIRDTAWKSYSASAQGQVHARENFTVTAGLRYDTRVDLRAKRLTPRLAFVWRARERHLVKAQYAEGFRTPTFFELYGLSQRGNSSLSYETVGTSELSYVFRDIRRTARATLFNSRLRGMIFPRGVPTGPPGPGQPPGPPPEFGNTSRAESRGVELEWEQQVSQALGWGANLSYAYARDTRTVTQAEQTPPGLSKWLGNLIFIARLRRNLLFTGHLYHVGFRATEAGGVDGYDSLDLSLSLLRAGAKGLTLRGTLKNALDARVRYLLNLPTGTTVNVYDGRTWGMQVGYEF
jgi:iron complex outermembrane receptor protein